MSVVGCVLMKNSFSSTLSTRIKGVRVCIPSYYRLNTVKYAVLNLNASYT